MHSSSMPHMRRPHFVYHHIMDVHDDPDVAVCRIAAALGEPARLRMLYCLLDGRSRTSTELAMAAGVSPSTASVHLNRLKAERLVTVMAQGKHRYYALEGPNVAAALEGLSVLAGGRRDRFTPNTPQRLRLARTCYDHIAGALGVALHDHFRASNWLAGASKAYELTASGAAGFQALGVDVNQTRMLRRRFAYPCLDWSERRPHIGGALGAAVLTLALRKRWIAQDVGERSLLVTRLGRREMLTRFGFELPAGPT